MFQKFAALFLTLLVGMQSATASENAESNNYYALVIGISDYADPDIVDLSTASNDADVVASILGEKYGFEVTLLVNEQATRSAIGQALEKLRRKAYESDSVLIYFAGHGELDELGGYWLPHDAPDKMEPSAEMDWISSSWIRDNLRVFRNRHVFVVADACFSGSLISSRSVAAGFDRNDTSWLSQISKRTSRWILSSGGLEPVADQTELSTDHSVFAHYFIDALRNLSSHSFAAQELTTDVARNVGNNAGQTPQWAPILGAGDAGGQFIFRPVGGLDLSLNPASPSSSVSALVTTNVASLPKKRRSRALAITSLGTVALSSASLYTAYKAKEAYLSSSDTEERERLQGINTVAGYSGYGGLLVGGTLMLSAAIVGEW